jgi:iron complex outermembrane receptor protein
MRVLILFLMAALTAFTVPAQDVTGVIRDAQGTPITGATISLLKDSSVVKLAVSKDKGAFSFSGIADGTYRVSASHVGFAPFVSAPFTVSGKSVTLPDLQIVKASAGMQGVVVTAKKPIVEVKADKTILNVEGTINATGSDALELLRKSPGVTVDKDENLSLSGKNGVQVYIDGRPSPLTGQDLAQYLKSMQSSQVEAIEIITNPSAKYEAAGNAGIINIRLKKNKSLGTNGSVSGGWNIGTYAKYNAGISFNHRNQNINIFGNYGYNQGRNINSITLNRTVLDTLFDQKGSFMMRNQSHNFKVGADYFINKKSTVGVMVNGNLATPEISNYSRTPISYIPTGVVDRILVADNSSEMKRNNLNYNLNYSFNDPKGTSLTLNADHGNYDLNSDQMQPNTYFDASGSTKLNTVVYQMIAPTDINISSFKADYEQNFMGGKLGLGGKTAFITTDNNFQRYNVFGSTRELDQERSNRFEYTENINALYANYNKAFKGFMIQAGLRMENTTSEGVSNGMEKKGSGYVPYLSSFRRSYTDLFPSAAITFNKNPMSQFGITYSRRIDRPYYQDLNPFEFKLDEYTFQKGNINLRPQYTNSFGVTHTYKFRLNTSLNYSHVNDMFTQLIDTADRSKAFMSKRNLAEQDIISLNVSYPFQYKSYSVFANINANYSHYEADFGEGRKIDLNVTGFNFFAQNSLKFAKTWTAELTGFYNAPTVHMGSIRAKSMWGMDAGFQKQVMKGKANLRASVSDVFNTMKFRGTIDFAGQKTINSAKWESRQFRLGFSYRFGNSQVKAARQRNSGADDEMKRAQQSGGTGIGQ